MLLSACASGPGFDSRGVDRSLTPGRVAAGPQPATGKQVMWGGTILHTTTLKDRTQMEVLAYPLDTNEQPQSESGSRGGVGLGF